MNNGDLVVEKEVMACYSDYKLYFEVSVMAYKGILLIFGAFLAFQTRKVMNYMASLQVIVVPISESTDT